MLKIGFIQAPGTDPRSYGIPLAFGYIASVLQHELDHPFDFRITNEPYDLVDYRPDVIGIGSVTSCFWQVIEFADIFRRELPDTNLVVGGHHISALPHRLPSTIDVGVIGEGEDTFLELMRSHEPGRGWEYDTLRRIPGITYRARNGNILQTSPRTLRRDLDTLPFPLRTKNPTRPDEAVVFTSRGCPFRCTYCSTQEYWESYRRFSAGYFVRELEHILETAPDVRSVYILDDLYVADRRRLREMARLIDAAGLNRRLSFHGFVRSNLVDEELCELLKTMNVAAIRFGAESGSDNVLQRMERGGKCSVATHQQAIDLAHRYDMACGASFMLGYPGETLDDMIKTFDFIHRNRDKMFVEGFYLTVPLPGTELWGWAMNKGLVSESMDWRSLNLSFDNPDFDWDHFLYLNEETVPRRAFVSAILESGILPETVAWSGRSNDHPNLALELMNRTLDALAKEGVRRVMLYGAGLHTRRLERDLVNTPVEIVGVIDDNEALHGRHLGRFRVHHPDEVADLAVEAIILSSDRHEERLWERRKHFERLGILVRRLYGPGNGSDRDSIGVAAQAGLTA
ncbi:MAG: radical SAM protein [Phycisphaerae bacterium]